jgi:hypothetical protein
VDALVRLAFHHERTTSGRHYGRPKAESNPPNISP